MNDKTVNEIAVSTCPKRMGLPCKFAKHDSGRMLAVHVARANATYHDCETCCRLTVRL
jgi:hypothetical protein